MTGDLAPAARRAFDRVTCLGCGCLCDDIRVTVSSGGPGATGAPVERVVDAANACPLGAAWFGDGAVPGRARVGGVDVPRATALDAVARFLGDAARPLVYLAPDLSCEAQRAGVALADRLGAVLDSVTSSTSIAGILAAQERGSAAASLGEVRNRADVVVFWGVDPADRYPRYGARYAPDPVGAFLPAGRRSRRIVSVDVGEARGPVDADVRIAVEPGQEVDVLTALAAIAAGTVVPAADAVENGSPWALAHRVAPVLLAAGYVAIVVDAEPREADVPSGRVSLGRAGALIGLAQGLNRAVRCGVSTLRAGGNRSGADAVLTAQTGFPCAVDFGTGVPRYEPLAGGAEARIARGDIDAVLLVGSASLVSASLRGRLPGQRLAIVGPRASESGLPAEACIDTGVPGIHESGTALRMDDVPLPLSAVLDGPPGPVAMLEALAARLPARLPA